MCVIDAAEKRYRFRIIYLFHSCAVWSCFFLFAFVLLAVNSHVSFAFRSFYWLAQWVAVHLQLFALDVYIYEGSAAQSKRAIEQCHQLPKWNNAHKNPNYNNLENMKSKTKRLGKCGMAKKVWWTVKMYLSKSH